MTAATSSVSIWTQPAPSTLPPDGVTGLGDSDAVTPAAWPETLRLTAELKPLSGLTVTLVEPDPPALMVNGEIAVKLKSAGVELKSSAAASMEPELLIPPVINTVPVLPDSNVAVWKIRDVVMDPLDLKIPALGYAQAGKHIAMACTIAGVAFNPVTALLLDVQGLIDSLRVSMTPDPITGYVVDMNGVGVPGAAVSIFDANGNTVATAMTDITGFYFIATTGGVLIPGASYTLQVSGLPTGFSAATPAAQPFLWQGAAAAFGNFVLN